MVDSFVASKVSLNERQFSQIKVDIFVPIDDILNENTGNTPSDYRDIRANSNIRFEDGTMSIANIQKSSEGYYLCEASNGIGAGLSAVIFVSVQGKFLIELN